MKLQEIKSCLITGATSGIGKALAIELGKRGVPLLLTGRNNDELLKLRDETGGEIFAADLANPHAFGELLRFVDDKNPNVQIHNAGYGLQGPFEKLADQEIVDMIQVNCTALALQTKRAIDRYKRKNEKGIILNVASIVGHFPFPFSALYGATKAFVRNLSIAVAGEQENSIVKVLTSCPGAVMTEFGRRASRGEQKKENDFGMPVEKAVKSIIHQIQSERIEVLFDEKYALLTRIFSSLPHAVNFFIARKMWNKRFKNPS